jgi:hypothetical protein
MMLPVWAKDTAIPWQGAKLSAAASTGMQDQSIILGDIQVLLVTTLGQVSTELSLYHCIMI